MSKSYHRRGGYRPLWVIAALLVLVAAGVVIWSRTSQTLGPPAPSADHQETDQAQTIAGTVADATMNTLTLETEAGAQYQFDTSDVQITTGETGVLIGNPAAVTYHGTLIEETNAEGVAVQTGVKVLSVTVEDAAQSPAPTPSGAESPAETVLAEMTLEEKVGQMFIARCPDTGAAEKAAEYHLGGYILFARDFENRTPEQAAQAIGSYQAAVDIPLFIGVDEEGGTVNRISRYPAYRDEPFPSPQELYAAGGLEAVRADTAEKCQLLKSLGVNVNFAPVCDVSTDPEDFIYPRSFGRGAEETAEYVAAVVEEMNGEGMACVLKHFPGYGDNEDTHTGIAHDGRSWDTFVTSDFLPFQAGIDAGAQMVLVSHNIVACMDPSTPASLSPAVHEILREELGFDGVIVTDDLVMDGVRDFAGDEEIAVWAVLAGNDLLCCTDFETQVPAVLSAVEDGTIPEARIAESVLRILEMKIELGLL